VALKTMFDPARAGTDPVAYQLRLGEQDFALRVSADGLELTRGEIDSPTATIVTDPGTLAAVLWHGLPIADAVAEGSLSIEGSKRQVARLARLFPPTAPAGAPAD
jgi:hypothetical protein